jgi:hypothetical protein
MKKLLLLTAVILLAVACKKKEFAPEGPTDIRIRNNSSQAFNEVILKTSEYEEDVFTFASIAGGATSDYHRFKKAYPKAEISLKVNIGGSLTSLTTGKVDYTYMQYLSTQKVTMVVDIINNAPKIINVIPEEELVLK